MMQSSDVNSVYFSDHVSEKPVKFDDFNVQKSDIFDSENLHFELKQKIHSVKDPNDFRPIFGDKLVDSYLATIVGKEPNLIEMGIELEKWKRLCELTIVYKLAKEEGFIIPRVFEEDSNSSNSSVPSISVMSRSNSSASSVDPEVVAIMNRVLRNSGISASDLANLSSLRASDLQQELSPNDSISNF